MTAFQLARIVDWAGTLKTRKRLQKVVYLLQMNGAPIEADYVMQPFGPYSSDVAGRLDQMVLVGQLVEDEDEFCHFSYRLSSTTANHLAKLEVALRPISTHVKNYTLAPFEETAKKLLAVDYDILRTAAVITYFRKQGETWENAEARTVQFNLTFGDSYAMIQARELAKGLIPWRGNWRRGQTP